MACHHQSYVVGLTVLCEHLGKAAAYLARWLLAVVAMSYTELCSPLICNISSLSQGSTASLVLSGVCLTCTLETVLQGFPLVFFICC